MNMKNWTVIISGKGREVDVAQSTTQLLLEGLRAVGVIVDSARITVEENFTVPISSEHTDEHSTGDPKTGPVTILPPADPSVDLSTPAAFDEATGQWYFLAAGERYNLTHEVTGAWCFFRDTNTGPKPIFLSHDDKGWFYTDQDGPRATGAAITGTGQKTYLKGFNP